MYLTDIGLQCSTSSEKVGLCLGSPCQQSNIVWYLEGQAQ